LDTVANYPVIRELGEGATSEVFLCQDPFRNRQVAVKRIFPEALRDAVRGRLFRKLFFTEASLAGKLVHPHIAQIYDAGIGEDSGYIVMEFVPGGTMERFCVPENLLSVAQVVDIVFKCTRALAFAHMQGVTHRDIKPGNLLYASEPTDVRIGDFGLALNVGARSRSTIRRRRRRTGTRCRRRSIASCAARCTRRRPSATTAATNSRRSWSRRCAPGWARPGASVSATPTSSRRCAACGSSPHSPIRSCGK